MKKIICLWGGPGTGKSTTSAELFALLKKLDYNCELNKEYIKDWVWEKRNIIPGDQVYIFAKHARKERIYMKSNLDFIITDLPLALCAFYSRLYDKYERENGACAAMLKQHYSFCFEHGYEIKHYYLNRLKKYNPEGRYQDEDGAKQLDLQILDFLKEFNIEYESVDCDENCAKVLVTKILGG
jgi:hypothetical protein